MAFNKPPIYMRHIKIARFSLSMILSRLSRIILAAISRHKRHVVIFVEIVMLSSARLAEARRVTLRTRVVNIYR